ncbi:MAG: DUF4834 family protein [Prevotella sp.]|nr:DUF4834 family protein [Prevotella sp.]
MLGSILFFILALLLIGVFIVVIIVRNLVYSTGLDRIFRLFRNQQNGGEDAKQGGGRRNSRTRRQTTTPSGDVIIDHRDPDKASQKIFRKDEGEYVDYKEEQ